MGKEFRIYSEAFKMQVVQEISCGKFTTILEAQKVYGICGANTIQKWIKYYNEERLHGALFYLPPEEVFQGLMQKRLDERRRKLYNAIINRRNYWQSLAASSEPTL